MLTVKRNITILESEVEGYFLFIFFIYSEEIFFKLLLMCHVLGDYSQVTVPALTFLNRHAFFALFLTCKLKQHILSLTFNGALWF